jgi:predicted nucleotidyltransferase
MRLTDDQVRVIREAVSASPGPDASVRVFGSRLRDDVRGGDLDLLLDLLVELPQPVDRPARLIATLGSRISRSMHGRRVDVLLLAPNLRRLPIHDVALSEGQLL